MRKLITTMFIVLGFILGRYYQQSLDIINIVNNCPLMVYTPDTIRIPTDTQYINSSIIFNDRSDIELFVKYVKTQSSRLDDDNWAVMKTMKNRMLNKNLTFSEYFYDNSLNNSSTIRNIRAGGAVPGFNFSWDNPLDVELFKRALDVYYGAIPDHIDTVITEDVRAFESHPKSWNQKDNGIFKRKNIVYEKRHEFYRVH